MRYIPISQLSAGMVCGKNLYDVNNQLMLKSGHVIRHSYIERIRHLGYQGIYIEDDFGADIVIKDVIPTEMRMTAVNLIRDICESSVGGVNNYAGINRTIMETQSLVYSIIHQITESEETLVNLIDLKFHDDYTFFHSVNVAILSMLLGTQLDLDKEELVSLGMSAILHDIGKMFISKSLLHKIDSLAPGEYEVLKQHTLYGYDFLRGTLNMPASVSIGALQHHEHYNGAGYPKGLVGDRIHLYGRIICLADVYDSLTANRPYRKAMSVKDALSFISNGKWHLFDPKLAEGFMKKIAPYPIGTYVRLNSGYIGIVYKNYTDAFNRPVIKVILDPIGKKINPLYVDLKNEKQLQSLTIAGANEMNVVEMIQKCS